MRAREVGRLREEIIDNSRQRLVDHGLHGHMGDALAVRYQLWRHQLPHNDAP